MKDLDFDELDRAVNSLVSQAKDGSTPSVASDRPEPSKSQPQTERPAAPAALSDEPTVATKPAQTAAPVLTPSSRTRLGAKRPTATPGRGSFIDIVAPKSSGAPTKVSRTGSALQPVSKPEALQAEPAKPQVKPEQPLAQTAPDEPPAEIAVEPTESLDDAAPVKTQQPSDEKWPDPLDFHEDKVVAEAAKVAQGPQVAEKTPKWQQNETGSSPFIPGAKVEKRPLGAFAPTEELPATPEKQDVLVADEPPKPKATAQPAAMPDELKPEVLAAESNQMVDRALDETDDEPENSAPVETEQPEPVQPEEPKVEQQVRESALQSIPQQYKTPTKQVSDVPRPVFDTKEYHPPLLEATAHAAHRSNPLGKLFIALLIVAVLAVGGYFAFLYFTQN